MKTIWRCKKCDSINIEIKVWMLCNTGEVTGDYILSECSNEDTYCCECGESRGIYEDTDQLQRPDKIYH